MANGRWAGPAGGATASIFSEKYELRDWAICLDTPASLIEEAVRKVGDHVDQVVHYLKERAGAA